MRLLSIIILSVLFTQESIDSNLKLEDFVFLAQELPDGCKIKPIASNARLPCDIKTNPFISSDRKFLDCFAGNLVQDPTLIQHVKKGLFSVYLDQAEIGIFGLEVDSEKTAELILKGMIKSNPNNKSSKLIQSGKIILWLWKDKGENNSFNELKKLIDARIK